MDVSTTAIAHSPTMIAKDNAVIKEWTISLAIHLMQGGTNLDGETN